MRPNRAAQLRRCRNSLIWAAATFLCCQLVGGLLIDYVWPGIRFRGLDDQLAQCRQASCTDRPVVLALGSSRFGCGLQPALVEEALGGPGHGPKVLNLSMPGGDFITAEHLYRRARETGCQPSLVFLEVSPETLARRNLWLDMHSLRQLTWLDGPRYAADLVRSGHALRYLASRFVPLYVHRDQLRHLALKELGLADTMEEQQRTNLEVFFNSAVVQSEKTLDAEQMLLKSTSGAEYIGRWLRNYQSGGRARGASAGRVRQLAAAGVPVVLVAPPVSSPHRDRYQPEIEQRFQAAIQRAKTRHPKLRFLDLRASLPDDQFYDNHHTTMTGARQFSHRLAQELITSVEVTAAGAMPGSGPQSAPR